MRSAVTLISFSTITGSVINHVIYDVKLAHTTRLSSKITTLYRGIISYWGSALKIIVSIIARRLTSPDIKLCEFGQNGQR